MKNTTDKKSIENEYSWDLTELYFLMEESDNFEDYLTSLVNKNSIDESYVLNILGIKTIEDLKSSGYVNEIIWLLPYENMEEKFKILWINSLSSFKKIIHTHFDLYEDIIEAQFLWKERIFQEHLKKIFYSTLIFFWNIEKNDLKKILKNDFFVTFLKTISQENLHFILIHYNVNSIDRFINLLSWWIYSDFMYYSDDKNSNKKLFLERYAKDLWLIWDILSDENIEMRYLLEKWKNYNLIQLFKQYSSLRELYITFKKKNHNLLKRSAQNDTEDNFKKILVKQFLWQNSKEDNENLNIEFNTKNWGWACADSDIHNLNILTWLQQEEPVYVLNNNILIGYIKTWEVLEQDSKKFYRIWDHTLTILTDQYEEGELLLIKWWVYHIEDVERFLKVKKIELSNLTIPLNINYLRTLNINSNFFDNFRESKTK